MSTTWPASWTSGQGHRASLQLSILQDLGFDSMNIKEILYMNNGPFPQAGDLIDKLEPTTTLLSEAEGEQKPTAAVPKSEDVSLLKETLRLVLQSKCHHCKSNPKSVVCVPCACLSLCTACEKIVTYCPYCNERIVNTIRTFT